MISFEAVVRAESGVTSACFTIVFTSMSFSGRAATTHYAFLGLSLSQEVWLVVEGRKANPILHAGSSKAC